jgi:hypothetical protein
MGLVEVFRDYSFRTTRRRKDSKKISITHKRIKISDKIYRGKLQIKFQLPNKILYFTA